MDTSETYIKMCEKAEEIQAHETNLHDWYVCKSHHEVMDEDGGYFSIPGCPDSSLEGKIIWLPRQDQLQEMIKGYCLEKLDEFYSFCMWDEDYEDLRENLLETSLEQLWLAFVMKRQYNKRWKGEKWTTD